MKKNSSVFFAIIKYLLIVIIIFNSLLLVYALFDKTLSINTLEYVESLESVKDPVSYIASFDPTNKSVVTLVKLPDPSDLIYGSNYRSSLYPYTRLLVKQVSEETCAVETSFGKAITPHSRQILIDNTYKVFWVGMAVCGDTYKLYGPYKL